MHVTRHDGFVVSTHPAALDRDTIHGFLREAYWSPNVPRETFERSVEHSLPFGLYDPEGRQAGFARVVSDRAVFAYLGGSASASAPRASSTVLTNRPERASNPYGT